jgi:hypothetical protein
MRRFSASISASFTLEEEDDDALGAAAAGAAGAPA